MKHLKLFTEKSIEELYGSPLKRAKEMVSDTLYYYYDGDESKLDSVYSNVLGDISEIIRNCVDHNEPEKMEFYKEVEKEVIKMISMNESLPRQQTVDQWEKLRKMTKGIDIGDRISDMNKQGANIQYIQNPVDTGIESYEDFEKHNKKFIPSWNLKHLTSPFAGEGKKLKK